MRRKEEILKSSKLKKERDEKRKNIKIREKRKNDRKEKIKWKEYRRTEENRSLRKIKELKREKIKE